MSRLNAVLRGAAGMMAAIVAVAHEQVHAGLTVADDIELKVNPAFYTRRSTVNFAAKGSM
jgi:hypothetical protein